MTDQHSPPSRYHHGDLRQALLDEAAWILREQGEAELSMRKLAARAGVSRSAPYHHFRDKQELLCGVAEEGFRHFASEVVMVPAAGDGSLAQADVEDFACAYLRFATRHREFYELMFGGQLWKGGEITASLRRESRRNFRTYVDEVRRWRDAGLVRDTLDPLRYAQVSWSTLHGISRFLIDGIYVDQGAMETLGRNAAAMFWRELGHRTDGDASPA